MQNLVVGASAVVVYAFAWAAWMLPLGLGLATWAWGRQQQRLDRALVKRLALRAGGGTGMAWGAAWGLVLLQLGEAPPVGVLAVLALGTCLGGLGITLCALDVVRRDD